ncbi:MAG TPA: hypothetical protein VMS95_02390 [Candidatus Krumholzibacteriaceae bacterium]|nr:hypothetical protein [Candidatus Krumholzibacteriaceae bacterium]
MRRVRFVIAFLIIATMILPSTRALFVKPSFPDYTPNGMPDFDEKQDQWGPVAGMYTWCCPVAVANSLWWLDSEYESFMFANPVPPPTISDHFGLVTSYNLGVWDDHDPNNVMGLVPVLAFCMDTDGMRTGTAHSGTRWVDVAPGIQMYLTQFTNVAGMFQVHSSDFPDFEWIDNQTEQCQDVELFIEFWQQAVPGGPWTNTTITNPSWEFGHCVTVAGTDLAASFALISDPYFDVATPGLPSHNDAQFVSHDGWSVNQWMMGPGPYGPKPIWELVNYCQMAMGLPPTYHAFIRGAVATSPAALPGSTAGAVGITGYKLLFKETVNNSFCIPVTIDYYWDFSIDKWDGTQWVASGISGSSTPVTGYGIPPFTIVDLPYYVYLLPTSVGWCNWLKVSFTFHWTYSGVSYSAAYSAKLHVHPPDIAGTANTAPYYGADGTVGPPDLGIISPNWKKTVTGGTDPTSNLAKADIDGDNYVGPSDLGKLSARWKATWTNTPPPG